MSDFAIECALIEAENKGLEGDAMLAYAAQANGASVSEAARVYNFLYNFQNRITERLGIAL